MTISEGSGSLSHIARLKTPQSPALVVGASPNTFADPPTLRFGYGYGVRSLQMEPHGSEHLQGTTERARGWQPRHEQCKGQEPPAKLQGLPHLRREAGGSVKAKTPRSIGQGQSDWLACRPSGSWGSASIPPASQGWSSFRQKQRYANRVRRRNNLRCGGTRPVCVCSSQGLAAGPWGLPHAVGEPMPTRQRRKP